MRAALASARVEPAEVGYVEAHGTGTSLGDPIEFEALASVYRHGRDRARPLVVGSLKTNLGHMESAAGIGGIIKTLLTVAHGEIPRHLHFREPNPDIDLNDIPASIPTSTDAVARRLRAADRRASARSGRTARSRTFSWPPPIRSRAASSAAPGGRPLQVLPISAKTDRALDDLVERYRRRFAEATDDEVADICYTAAVGRAHFPTARGVRRRRRRKSSKRRWRAAGLKGPPDMTSRGPFRAAIPSPRTSPAPTSTGRPLDRGRPCARVDAPTYPFQRERHWVADPATVRIGAQPIAARPAAPAGLRFGVMFFNGTEARDGAGQLSTAPRGGALRRRARLLERVAARAALHRLRQPLPEPGDDPRGARARDPPRPPDGRQRRPAAAQSAARRRRMGGRRQPVGRPRRHVVRLGLESGRLRAEPRRLRQSPRRAVPRRRSACAGSGAASA